MAKSEALSVCLTHNGVQLSMIAGTDLKISGNPASGPTSFQGRHYAGHQISFSGSPSINGNIIAANLADTASPGSTNFVQLSSGFMEVSSHPTITYNSSGGGTSRSTILVNWREVRNQSEASDPHPPAPQGFRVVQ